LTLFVRKNGREALQQQHIGSRAFSSEVEPVRVKKMRLNKEIEHPI
jgi:hypothetical protein